ncbi:MAG: hypothetical protein DYG98_26455 [Haliscomenobacteraceae bacterium CHB4]|nr:hypothetical protein [Saprospiraceae bacterium]MCE7926602.1 hypothetical protein [Haliscomenobacteraceae bacterium CHB4]
MKPMKPTATQHFPYRYPGARPFATDQQHLFFGRDRAVRELYNRLQLEQLVVLYSKSGLGKSSLLNAGLLPRVREEGRWQPITVRFNAWIEGKTETPVQITRDLLLRDFDRPTFLPKIFPDDRSLWYAAKTRQLNAQPSPGNGLLLVFDQFEELFTYPEEAVQQLGRQLAEILQMAVPQRVRKMAELFLRAQPELLTDAEEAALESRLDVRIIFAIRSDRLSLLDRLSIYVPQILAQRYELQSLSPVEAHDAIVHPAQKEGNFVTPPFEYASAALDTMLAYLTKGGAQPIESFQLQILCQSIEQYVARSADYFIEPGDVGDPEQVFRDYYDNQIALIEDPAEQLSARRLIEEGLVYEKEQRRLTLFDVQIRETYGISDDLLRRLVDTHLLRAEPNLRGGYTYELSHDTLVTPVLKAKARRVEAEVRAAEAEAERHRLAELAEAERQRQAELAEERRKRQRATRYAAIGFLLAAISIAASVFAVQQSRLAHEAQVKAEHAQQAAEKSLLELKKKQVDDYLKKAETHRLTGEPLLELKMLRAALEVDSTRGDLQEQVRQLERRHSQTN